MQHDKGSLMVSGIILLVLHCSYLPHSCRSSCPSITCSSNQEGDQQCHGLSGGA